MSEWTALIWFVVLLIGNAFFVASEFAIMSARRSQIEPLAEAGNKRAQTALRAMEHVSLMLACSQLGITVCSLVILNVAEPAVHHLVAEPLMHLGLAESAADLTGFLIALLVVTFAHVIFGEMVPKNISVSTADRAALWLAPVLVVISRLVRPIIWFMNWIANAALRLMRIEPKDEVSSTFTADELQTILEESTAEGLVTDADGMLSGALEFSEKTVSDVMVPVDQVLCLPSDSSPHDLERAVGRTGFSRFVLESEDGTYLGYLHVKADQPAPGDHRGGRPGHDAAHARARGARGGLGGGDHRGAVPGGRPGGADRRGAGLDADDGPPPQRAGPRGLVSPS